MRMRGSSRSVFLTPCRICSGERETDEEAATVSAPLAARMRPRTLEEFVGQEHILGPGKLLRRAIEADRLPSLILSGRRAQANDAGSRHRGNDAREVRAAEWRGE